MSTVFFLAAVTQPPTNFADKFLMVILGLAIVVPTLFLVGAVLISRRVELEDPEEPKGQASKSKPDADNG